MSTLNIQRGDMVWVRDRAPVPGGYKKFQAKVADTGKKGLCIIHGNNMCRWVLWSDLARSQNGPWGREVFEKLTKAEPAPVAVEEAQPAALRRAGAAGSQQPVVQADLPLPQEPKPEQRLVRDNVTPDTSKEYEMGLPMVKQPVKTPLGEPWTAEHNDAFTEAVEAGFSYEEIATYVGEMREGVTPALIKKRIFERGLYERYKEARQKSEENSATGENWDSRQKNLLESLYREGKTDEEIAAALATLRPGVVALHVKAKRLAMRLLRRRRGNAAYVMLQPKRAPVDIGGEPPPTPPPYYTPPAVTVTQAPPPPAITEYKAPERTVRVTFESTKGKRVLEVDEATAKAMISVAVEL